MFALYTSRVAFLFLSPAEPCSNPLQHPRFSVPRDIGWAPGFIYITVTHTTCLAYAKGNCSQGENCTHYHIDLSNLHCKFQKREYCKFGSNCLFKHDSFPLKDPDYCELSPVIQQTVKENLEMKSQLALCNSKILDLEKAIKEHATQLSEIRGHLHTHKTPQHPVATEMVWKPPISRPPNTSTVPKKPTLKRSTLPWIPATKRKFNPPKLKTPPPIEFVDRKPVIPILQHNERRSSPKIQLKRHTEALPACPSTQYELSPAKPLPDVHTYTTEENFTDEMSADLHETKELLKILMHIYHEPYLAELTWVLSLFLFFSTILTCTHSVATLSSTHDSLLQRHRVSSRVYIYNK